MKTSAIVVSAFLTSTFSLPTLADWENHGTSIPRDPAGGALIIPKIVPDPVKPIAESGLEFSAFFDVQYASSNSDSSSVPAQAESGFLLEDGAIYLKKVMPKLEIFVDLPLSRAKTPVDRNNDGTPDGFTSDNSNMVFAANQAQLFGTYSLSEATKLTIGQFDTIFGMEANDSKDRLFAVPGALSDEAFPYTHAGVMLGHDLSETVGLKFFGANPAGKGSFGSTEGDDSLEVGAAMIYTGDSYRALAGFLNRDVKNLKGDADRKTLFNVSAGATFGKFSLDLDFASIRDPRKNSLSTDATDVEDSGHGTMLIASYKLTNATTFAVRAEQLLKDPGSSGKYETTAGALGLHYQLSDNLVVRGDVYSKSVKASENADAVKSGKVVFSSIFIF